MIWKPEFIKAMATFCVAFWMLYNCAAILVALVRGDITSSRSLFYSAPAWENKLSALVMVVMYGIFASVAFVVGAGFVERSYLLPMGAGLLLFICARLAYWRVYG